MELIYLWIGQYANINNKGFNFSNKFHVHFEESQLTILEVDNYIENFYHKDIIGITAIAGANGSGKTNLLSFIENFFLTDGFRSYGNCFLILHDNKNNKFSITKKDTDINEKINCPEKHSAEIIKGFESVKENILPILYISGLEIRNRYPISSSFLELSGQKFLEESIKINNREIEKQLNALNEDYKDPDVNLVNDGNYASLKEHILKYNTPLYHFKNEETKAQVEFICKNSIEGLDFIPRFLELQFNPVFYRNKYELFKENPLYKKLADIIFNPNLEPYANETLCKKHLKQGILAMVFLYLVYYEKEMGIFHLFKVEDWQSQIKSEDADEQIAQKIENFIRDANFRISGWSVDFNSLKELIVNLDTCLDGFKVYSRTNNRFVLERNEKTSKFINYFFSFWTTPEFAFTFELAEMSAGQKAMLTLLSRIFTSRYLSEIHNNKSILLLIDEGELYLHPEWQRRFLNDLIKYIPSFFKGRKVQLILTTHSPFVLSDLPKENIVLLDREEKNIECKIIDTKSFPQTFGNNIHDLLADSFFMKNGTIGDFSSKKIDSLLNFLSKNENDENDWSIEKGWKVINLIGDEIIRRYLIELVTKKVLSQAKDSDAIDHLDQQMQRLKKEKERLKGGNNDQN